MVQVLGALGEGLDAPLLVETFPDKGRLVLAAAGEPALRSALRALGEPRILTPSAVVQADGRELGVFPYVAGLDLYELDDRGRLSPGIALRLVAKVAALLAIAHEAGIAHGDLSPASVRVLRDGDVCLVGFQGGEPSEDLPALRAIAEHLLRVQEAPELAGRLRALLESWPTTATKLVQVLDDHVSAIWSVPSLAPENPPLFEHPLAGRTVKLSIGAAPSAPPKVRVAGIAALTLVLGVAGGYSLAWSPAGSPELSVLGASQVQVDCDPVVREGARLGEQATRCRVIAEMSSGETLHGEVDMTVTGGYLCRPHQGALRCTER